MKLHTYTISIAIIILGLIFPASSHASKISYESGIPAAMARDDSLQGAAPSMSCETTVEAGISSELVNGKSDALGIIPSPDSKPATFTWDLGKSTITVTLKQLDIWIRAGGRGNFTGELAVSNDGKTYTPITGTAIDQAFTSNTGFNVIRCEFSPSEVSDFRYLQLRSFGKDGIQSQLAEIDAWLSGVSPELNSIKTTISALDKKDAISIKSIPSQVSRVPMKVRGIKFADGNLILTDGTILLRDLIKTVEPPDAAWKITSHKSTALMMSCIYERNDGLIQQRTFAINKSNLMSLNIDLSLPKTASAATYESSMVDLYEGDVRFDQLTTSSYSPITISRARVNLSFGTYAPYVILTAPEKDIELHLFVPNWYNIPGQLRIFDGSTLLGCDLPISANNPLSESGDTGGIWGKHGWNNIPVKIQPGEKLNYQINLAAFTITPPSIGEKDITTNYPTGPLGFIDMGSEGKWADQNRGVPGVYWRDKMVFLGFHIPSSPFKKPGHQFQVSWPELNDDKLMERYAKAGAGVMVWTSPDFADVAHGVSWGTDYDKAPDGFREALKKVHKLGMKTLLWFSPRGALRAPAGNERPKADVNIKLHPEWFLSETHWYGLYQTINPFVDAASQWMNDKIRLDMERYPDIDGIALDTFPFSGTTMGPDNKTTLVRSEQNWLQKFSNTVHSFGKDKLVMANGGMPLYDDYDYYDYTVAEHPLLMDMDAVTRKSPFTRPYAAGSPFLTDPNNVDFWAMPLKFMYYNFCDYNSVLGWTHPHWVMLKDGYTNGKSVDDHIAPLWYIMGRGERTYGAQIAAGIRQIEAVMPDGSRIVAIASILSTSATVNIQPQTVKNGRYRVATSVDDATKHADMPVTLYNSSSHSGFYIRDIPPYSITVMKFRLM